MGLQEANSSPVSWCDRYRVGTGLPGAGWSLPILVERWSECVRAQQKLGW